MRTLEQLALAGQGVTQSLRLVPRGALWKPWLVLAAAQFAALAALWMFAHPAVSWLMAPLLVMAGGEAMLHYPESLRQLPWLFARADLAIALTLGPLVTGWALAAFGDAFGARPPRAAGPAARAARRYGSMWLAQLPLQLVVLALGLGLEGWLGQQRHGILVRAIERLMVQGGLFAAQTLLLWAPALVAIGGYGARDALAELPWSARRAGWSALALVVLGTIAILPFQLLTERAASGVGGAAPERVLALLSLEIVAALVFAFVAAGSAALIYLSVLAQPDAERA